MDRLNRNNASNSIKGVKSKYSLNKLPRLSLFAKKEEIKSQFRMGKKDINHLIYRQHNQAHSFSQSLLDPYTPLTIKEKEKVIEDMNETSTNRFKEYNDIFDKIKQQLSDINNSLYESGNESCSKRPHRKTVENKRQRSIEEKEVGYYFKSKFIANTVPKYNYDSFIDDEAFNENVNAITIKSTSIRENSKLLSCKLNTKKSNGLIRNNMLNTVNKMLFIEARTEYKKRRKIIKKKKLNQTISNGLCSNKKTFNSKDFYYEPSITSESNINKKEIPVKYCNCLIV